MVKKVETDHRGSLLPATVRSLLHVKLNSDESCHDTAVLQQVAANSQDRHRPEGKFCKAVSVFYLFILYC